MLTYSRCMIATVCYCTFFQLSLASGKTIAGGTLYRQIMFDHWNPMEPYGSPIYPYIFWGRLGEEIMVSIGFQVTP